MLIEVNPRTGAARIYLDPGPWRALRTAPSEGDGSGDGLGVDVVGGVVGGAVMVVGGELDGVVDGDADGDGDEVGDGRFGVGEADGVGVGDGFGVDPVTGSGVRVPGFDCFE